MIGRLTRSGLPKPGDPKVLAGLTRPVLPRLRIDRFPVGTDGSQVDVALGPALDKATRLFVGSLLQEHLALLWGEPSTPASDTLAKLFREQVRQHHHTAVRQARDATALERVQLFQLAVLKLVLDSIDDELGKERQALEDARAHRDRQMSGRGLLTHRQAALLGRQGAQIRYRTARRAVRELNRLEHAELRSLRKSVLGRAWPVAEELLANPILQLDGIGGLRDFSENYPVLLHDLSVARQVGNCLSAALSPWLPDSLVAVTTPAIDRDSRGAARRDGVQGSGRLAIDYWARQLIDARELAEDETTWLDEPANIAAMLGGDAPVWPDPGPWSPRDFSAMQRQLNARFGRLVTRSGLQQRVMASYALREIYPSLGVTDAEGAVFDYLAGRSDRRNLQRRLQAVDVGGEQAQLRRIKRIDKKFKAFRRQARAGRQPMLARLASDFGALRRDLKLALQTFEALGRIRLLKDPDKLSLSRTNNTLQAFCPQSQLPDRRGNLVGHAVIRFDVRGTQALVESLSARGVNAAAYFSRYLYDPLTQLLGRFDAQKVTVDSGTLVLTTFQYSGDGLERLAVARACALALALLEQIEAMNAESERRGLPGLEVSVGIVHCDAPPRYLYEQSRRVLVSPANSLARRMSSCDALLRQSCSLPGGRGLCVAMAAPGASVSQDPNELVRYNVNGIELDHAAFVRLHAELSMRKVRVKALRRDESIRLHIGQCPDLAGGLNWLAVREQPVKLWFGRQLLDSPNEGRSFFELVTDARLIARVRDELGKALLG